jgi:hypothetical protein
VSDISDVMLFRDAKGWGVGLELRDGGLRRYRYGSEAQARYYAAILSLKPRVLPEGGEVKQPPAQRPARRRTGRRAARPAAAAK